MVVEVLKAQLGLGDSRRRYIDIESVRELEDISDPETTENESKQTLRDTAHEHPFAAILAAIVAVVAVGLGVMYTARLAPGVLTNKWTWIAIGVGVYTTYIYRRGWSGRDNNVTKYDELTLKMNGNQTTYKGTLVQLAGRAPAFIPIKGWERWGHKARPYLNSELAAAMVDSLDRQRVGGDTPAVIRLEPGKDGDLLSISDSEWGGTHITQETSGLKPDPNGNETSLFATFPDFDDNRANSLADQLEQVTKDYYDAIEEVESLARRNKNLKDRLNEPIEDEVNRRIRQFGKLADAGERRSRRASPSVNPRPRQDDWRGTGALSNGHDSQSEIDEVDEELEEQLSDDDD